MAKKPSPSKTVDNIHHDHAKRTNIPTAEHQPVVEDVVKRPIPVAYAQRNADLDPQLIWRGKYDHDTMLNGDLVVAAPPLYIQEKITPKMLIADLLRHSQTSTVAESADQLEMFNDYANFNGLPAGADKTDFYQHQQNWTNRMILGDSLHVMTNLAEREGLRGKVQCIYFDPPYGIKFNSNFQWSTTNRDVKDGKADNMTREPEQVRAFRDTWCDGIHSYLTYLRNRLIVARDLLSETGSIFIQIGDENVHRVRAVMDEVFGEGNFVSQIAIEKTSSSSTEGISSIIDNVIWFSKNRQNYKIRQSFIEKVLGGAGTTQYTWMSDFGEYDHKIKSQNISSSQDIKRIFACDNITSQRPAQGSDVMSFYHNNKLFYPGKGTFKTDKNGLERLAKATRLRPIGNTLMYKRYINDFPLIPVSNYWNDTKMTGFSEEKTYVVQTASKVIQRCILMTTDPGDLVLDPTCGSGTTATVAEQWGRRWITIDTSRVALALARARIMGARYPWYLLTDSPEGQRKEAELRQSPPSEHPTYGDIRHGFVYERVPHITLKSIANNADIDVIYDRWQETLEPLRQQLNQALGQSWQDWEIPRDTDPSWGTVAQDLHSRWWDGRIKRQQEIDASIAAKADMEYLYDKPYEDKKKVRVAGPFTVESLSPHRTLGVGADEELIDPLALPDAEESADFVTMILDNLKVAGVQQTHKGDKITFTDLTPWPGEMICAEGHYQEGETQKRAAIFIGPEFGTVGRDDLVSATREAADAGFDILISCAFNYEAHTNEFNKIGRINVLKARMNADLHMGKDLKNTTKGNLFVVFGEPDIDIIPSADAQGNTMITVKIKGMDVFHPNSGKVRSDDTNGIACWFIDTDYDNESFFVRHAYFIGASNDPYKSLQTSLKAEINPEAWATLRSDTSRPFLRPAKGRIAVKVINHLGDEVMKVYKV